MEENSKTILIMSKICRSCMAESNELQSLFTKLEMVGLETQLSDMLTACSSVQISTSDRLPSSLCRHCVDQLSNAFTFKQQCELTDSKLREYLNSIETDEDLNIKQESESLNIVVKPDIDITTPEMYEDSFANDDWDLSEDEVLSEKVKKNHQCHICFKKLASTVGLKLHLQKHHKCELCEQNFDKLADLRKHKLEVHSDAEEPNENQVKTEQEDPEYLPEKRTRRVKVEPVLTKYECTECHKELRTFNGLQLHKRRHTGKNLVPCYICSKTFTKLSHLKRHLLVHGIQNPTADEIGTEQGKVKKECYQCEFCDKKFVYKKSFAHHMKTEHAISDEEPAEPGEVPKTELEEEQPETKQEEEDHEEEEDGKEYDCHVCNQKFTKANYLTRHMTLHRSILHHKCTQCEKVFLTPEHLETHLNENHKERSYSCTNCDKQFSRGEHLIRHLKSEHDKDPDTLACSICSKQFPSADQLAKHIKQHILQDKRHACKICKKAFNRLDNLRTHQRVHTGEVAVRLHLCIYCGKEFNNSSNMIVHMRRHTGERPYKCQVCGKGFPRSHDLKCHERTHSGERPYLCTLCGKSFNKSNKLVRHTRVHTGERPYVCSLCGRAFTQSNDLALHMRRHTGSRPYACGVCPARFIQSGQLKAHRRTQGHWVEQEVQFRGNRVEPVHIEGLVETKIKYRKSRSNPTVPNPLLLKNINLLTGSQTEGNFGVNREAESSSFEASSFEAVPTTSANFQGGFNFPHFG